MDNDYKKIVEEELAKMILESDLTDLDFLHDNISSQTVIGKYWFNLVSSLQNVIDEINTSSTHSNLTKQKPITQDAIRELSQIIEKLKIVKPLIITLDQLEQREL